MLAGSDSKKILVGSMRCFPTGVALWEVSWKVLWKEEKHSISIAVKMFGEELQKKKVTWQRKSDKMIEQHLLDDKGANDSQLAL